MSLQHQSVVEFYGGPIDGQVTQLEAPLKPFVVAETVGRARHVSVFVQLFRALFFDHQSVPPVLAIYELRAGDELQPDRYTYLRSTLASDLCLAASQMSDVVQSMGVR